MEDFSLAGWDATRGDSQNRANVAQMFVEFHLISPALGE